MSPTPKPVLVVPHARSVGIELRPPHHGWLDCAIELGDFRLEVSASEVSNDPLEELVDMGIFLSKDASRMRRVCLWTEPAGYALDVWNVGPALSRARVGADSTFVPPMAGYALQRKHDCSVERTVLARAIREAVDDLFRRAGPRLARPHWHDPARYADAVAQLRALTRE